MASDTLAQITASRICHDLISPIGALSNGLELAREAGRIGGEEQSLIEDCAKAAGATLAYYRFAFGAASDDDGVSAAEATAIAAPFLSQRRIALKWPAAEREGRATVKLRLLLLLCLLDALPRGGAIRGARTGEIGWIAAGEKTLPDRVRERLEAASAGAQPTPGDVHVRLMLDEARARGMDAAFREDGKTGEIELTLT